MNAPHEVGTDDFCCVAHYETDAGGHFALDANGRVVTGPACQRCRHCKQWVRPKFFGDPCPK